MAARNTVKRSAPAALRPELAFYAGSSARYNRILAEHGAIAEACASGDRASVQHAVSGALIDATSIASSALVHRPLLRYEAAVDDELGAGHERGFVGCKEQHAVSNLDRLAEAA